MEHPFKTILKAFGIVLVVSIAFGGIPLIIKSFGTTEWQLMMGVAILLIILMLVQINTNANILRAKQRVKSNN